MVAKVLTDQIEDFDIVFDYPVFYTSFDAASGNVASDVYYPDVHVVKFLDDVLTPKRYVYGHIEYLAFDENEYMYRFNFDPEHVCLVKDN